MKALIIALLGLLPVGGLVIAPSQAAAAFDSGPGPVLIKSIGGTIEEIDYLGQRVTIQTERGRQESFTLPRASLLIGLAEGDRVSVEMDDQGKIRKIVKTTPDIMQRVPKPLG